MKTFKQTLSVLLSLILTLSAFTVLPVSAAAADDAAPVGLDTTGLARLTGFTATGGVNGYLNQDYFSLVDGNIVTKWCNNTTLWDNGVCWIEFSAETAIVPRGYSLATGNDTNRYPGRNPMCWTLKARQNESDSWTVLADVTEGGMGTENQTFYDFALTNPTTQAYQYYRFEVTQVTSDNRFQLGELALWYNTDELISYVDAEGNSHIHSYIPIQSSDQWDNNWYALTQKTSLRSRIEITGDVNLVLCDGVALSARQGIHVPPNASLTIWGQSEGTGELRANMKTSSDSGKACIGGNENEKVGSITINGGVINAYNSADAAGIGSGSMGTGGSITINGGKVSADGGANGAGIGGGKSSDGGNITINGGEVSAYGGDYGAGIGGGLDGCGGRIIITGGTVSANSKFNVAIGGVTNSNDLVRITGGTVTANQSYHDSSIERCALEIPGMKVTVPEGVLADARENVCHGVNLKVKLEVGDEHFCNDGGACIYCGEQVPPLPYIDEHGEAKTHVANPVSDQAAAWSAGWYAVTSDMTISSRIDCTGSVNLILCDGAELSVPKGINVAEGNSLTIWQQVQRTGKLTVTSPESHYAALGGGDGDGTGDITVNGGVLNLKATFDAAGIGGGYGGSAGNIVINAGDVTAQGGGLSAAIGSGGGYGSGGNVTINGGKITAIGGSGGAGGAAGIGTSHRSGKTAPGKTLTVNINGGDITATGGSFGAGIGGGSYRYCNFDINIKGGTITATGGLQSAGIGGGREGSGGTINISGGSITATGGSYNGGSTGAGGTITITGGTITATPGSDADAQAIGHGTGTEDSGTLTLGNDAVHIKVGTVSGESVSYVDAEKRISTAQSHTAVRTEVCTEHTYNEAGVCWCGEQTTAYTITFVDEDGTTVLQQSNYKPGLTPAYKGETPTKKGDAQYSYIFSGWTPEITAVTSNTTYTAQYDIIGDVNRDGKVNICDVTAIQRHLADLEVIPEQFLMLADTNGDGKIDIADATHLLMYLAEFDGIVLGKQ